MGSITYLTVDAGTSDVLAAGAQGAVARDGCRQAAKRPAAALHIAIRPARHVNVDLSSRLPFGEEPHNRTTVNLLPTYNGDELRRKTHFLSEDSRTRPLCFCWVKY